MSEPLRAIDADLPVELDRAEQAVRAALAEQGFGVLTEIDVAATFREKLGIERSPLKILGACNPTLAEQALRTDPSAALVLPCNVVLETTEHGTRVAAVDPRTLMPDPAMADLAADAAARLTAALEAARQSVS